MAMLAEPRRRQKWTLNPRGTLWSNDDNKFGQKLMEKMGWSKGKGLGREEQGDKDHISVRIKDNTKGLGFKGKDDVWVKHYEGFEHVLAMLNSENNSRASSPCSDAPSNDANLDCEDSKPKSLEALSKKSVARVHYHKFTRGKDLSRLNSDDIACITGSKRSKQLAKIAKKEKFEEVEIGKTEQANGVTTIKGGNIQDYFAMKMALLNNSASRQAGVTSTEVDTPLNEELEDNEIPKDSETKKRKKKKKNEDVTDISVNKGENSAECGDTKHSKKKRKQDDVTTICVSKEEITSECGPTKRKKKKVKQEDITDICVSKQENASECEDTNKSKTKKKRENDVEMCNTNGENSLENSEMQRSKKKKKKEILAASIAGCTEEASPENNLKRNEKDTPDIVISNEVNIPECKGTKKSKKEKKREQKIANITGNSEENILENIDMKGSDAIKEEDILSISECGISKKSKKKKKGKVDADVSCSIKENTSEYDAEQKEKNSSEENECNENKKNKKKRKKDNHDISKCNEEISEYDETKKEKDIGLCESNKISFDCGEMKKKKKRKTEKLSNSESDEKLASKLEGEVKKKKKRKESQDDR